MSYQLYFGQNRICDNCKESIENTDGFYLYRFDNGVGVEICSSSCAKEYSANMKRQNYRGGMRISHKKEE